ncbi:hypothetical protein [Nitrosopumilus sp. S4]
MHCDDKRTLFVLKEEIEKTWNLLKKSDFKDKDILRMLNDVILDYTEYKKES